MNEINNIKDGAGTRLLRIEKLLELIKNNPDAEERRVIALFSRQSGLSEKKTSEYIRELVSIGEVSKENEKLVLRNQEA